MFVFFFLDILFDEVRKKPSLEERKKNRISSPSEKNKIQISTSNFALLNK